mmetsp:Transcript_83904/g.140021  ORF Transcript_83904/g.140021 Transcript_83904/m.140021 type:complete len:247 (-) Transcript_83904:764-1504(-)
MRQPLPDVAQWTARKKRGSKRRGLYPQFMGSPAGLRPRLTPSALDSPCPHPPPGRRHTLRTRPFPRLWVQRGAGGGDSARQKGQRARPVLSSLVWHPRAQRMGCPDSRPPRRPLTTPRPRGRPTAATWTPPRSCHSPATSRGPRSGRTPARPRRRPPAPPTCWCAAPPPAWGSSRRRPRTASCRASAGPPPADGSSGRPWRPRAATSRASPARPRACPRTRSGPSRTGGSATAGGLRRGTAGASRR